MVDGSYVNYYQNTAVSTSDVAVDAGQTILDNPALAGALLSGDSPLSAHSQAGLMTDLIHQAQGDFIAGTADYTGTALEKAGNGLAIGGYAVSATGVGAGVGAAMSGVGNGLSRIGTGLKLTINISEGEYGQMLVSFIGSAFNAGMGRVAAYGAAGREAIEGGTNLFFSPVNTFLGNLRLKYKKQCERQQY